MLLVVSDKVFIFINVLVVCCLMLSRKPLYKGENRRKDGVSAGENGKIDGIMENNYGVSRQVIKELPANTIADVKAKTDLLMNYLEVRRQFAMQLSDFGFKTDLLMNELADLQVMQAVRERDLQELKRDPLEDRVFMDNKDRIINLLLQLQKLGVDVEKLNMEKERNRLSNLGTAFVVDGKE
jgi:hypothetical protein